MVQIILNTKCFDKHTTACKACSCDKESFECLPPMSGISDEPEPISVSHFTHLFLIPSPEIGEDRSYEVPDALLLTVYIKNNPHPHSLGSKTIIIPLDRTTSVVTSADSTPAYIPHPTTRPWAPFHNCVDFEYMETAIEGLLSKKLMDCQLAGICGSWPKDGSHLTLHSWMDMEHSLNSARNFAVQVDSYFLQQSKILLTIHIVYSRQSLHIISRRRIQVQVWISESMGMDA